MEQIRQTRAKYPTARLQTSYNKKFNAHYPLSTERQLARYIQKYLNDNIVKLVDEKFEQYYHKKVETVERFDEDDNIYFIATQLRQQTLDELEKTEKGAKFPLFLLGLSMYFRYLDSFAREEYSRFLSMYIDKEYPIDFVPNIEKIEQSFISDIGLRIKRTVALYYEKVLNAITKFQNTQEGLDALRERIKRLGIWLGVAVSAFVARDIVGSFYSRLQGVLSNTLGIRFYKWQTAHDERVRGDPSGLYPNAPHSHYDMDGLLCDNQNPSIVSHDNGKTWVQKTGRLPIAHPGEEYNCRCVRVPYINGILAQIDQRRR